MNRVDYLWQLPDWPNWRYDLAALTAPLTAVSHAQGRLLGRLADVGFDLRNHACLAALTDDVVKTSEIEGEHLNVESVRSSIAPSPGRGYRRAGSCGSPRGRRRVHGVGRDSQLQ
jgi:Fic family protein